MTYRQILEKLKTFSDEQLSMTPTVYDGEIDEWMPIQDFLITDKTDVLDENHPYFTLND